MALSRSAQCTGSRCVLVAAGTRCWSNRTAWASSRPRYGVLVSRHPARKTGRHSRKNVEVVGGSVVGAGAEGVVVAVQAKTMAPKQLMKRGFGSSQGHGDLEVGARAQVGHLKMSLCPFCTPGSRTRLSVVG